MYIDQLTLFIVGEIALVYVVITIFMLYRNRLFHVLVALLKELRGDTARQLEAQLEENAALQAENERLMVEMQNLSETGGVSFSGQLQQRIDTLTNRAKQTGTNLKKPPGPEDDYQLEWLRRRILQLEKEIATEELHEDDWRPLAQNALEDAGLESADPNRKAATEDATQASALEKQVKQYRTQYESARDRISLLEGELDQIKSINTVQANHYERPEMGAYTDQLYKLKCEKFDLQESINQLNLKIQQMDPGSDEYIRELTKQLNQLEKYMKDADININLLEKELEAAHHENEALEGEVKNLKNRLKDIATTEDRQAILDLKNIDKLSGNTNKQAQSVATLKESIEQLRNGEPQENVLELQESEVARLELLVRDSANSIAILEMELEQAQSTIDQLTERERELLAKLESGLSSGDTPAPSESKGSTTDQLEDLNNQQQASLGELKTHVEAIRNGGDAMEIIIQQEQEIAQLENLLLESKVLMSNLEKEIQAGAPATEASAKHRPDSNEDMEEMELLLQQFMTDSQTMLTRIKELEDENKRLSNAAKGTSRSEETG